jgi:hypothetical protein
VLSGAVWPIEEKRLLAILEPLATFGIALATVLVVRHVLLRWLRRRAASSKSLAPAVLETIRLPSVLDRPRAIPSTRRETSSSSR